jgi:pyrimidine deaminase RibD-like protein
MNCASIIGWACSLAIRSGEKKVSVRWLWGGVLAQADGNPIGENSHAAIRNGFFPAAVRTKAFGTYHFRRRNPSEFVRTIDDGSFTDEVLAILRRARGYATELAGKDEPTHTRFLIAAMLQHSQDFLRHNGLALEQLNLCLWSFVKDGSGDSLDGWMKILRPSGSALLAADSSPEEQFMRLAVDEARKCTAEDSPDAPRVGAVLVGDGRVLAQAHRGEPPYGTGDHAEVILLEHKLAKVSLEGTTLYTTLEPSFATRIIDRGITTVVYGMIDPNEKLRGLGESSLADAGIGIGRFTDPLRKEIEELNRKFRRAKRVRQPGR